VSLAEREQMAVERVAGDQQQTAHDAQIACNGGATRRSWPAQPKHPPPEPFASPASVHD
jgi:hypothetical protein